MFHGAPWFKSSHYRKCSHIRGHGTITLVGEHEDRIHVVISEAAFVCAPRHRRLGVIVSARVILWLLESFLDLR